MNILEIKKHINKPDERYECELLERLPDGAILKYVNDRPGRVAGVFFDTGSVTYALYRAHAGHVLWKMVAPSGRLKGHLFHISRDLKVGADRLEYQDLLLDLWVDPKGDITVLDRDEVEDCEARGLIGRQEVEWIEAQAQVVRENAPDFISGFDELLGGIGPHVS